MGWGFDVNGSAEVGQARQSGGPQGPGPSLDGLDLMGQGAQDTALLVESNIYAEGLELGARQARRRRY